ncbi:MAG: hypothetical protein ACPGXL_03675 [Chitinophagales bacterium]
MRLHTFFAILLLVSIGAISVNAQESISRETLREKARAINSQPEQQYGERATKEQIYHKKMMEDKAYAESYNRQARAQQGSNNKANQKSRVYNATYEDMDLNPNEKAKLVEGYKVSLMPKPINDNAGAYAVMNLYDDKQSKVGTINFYGNESSKLSSKINVNQTGYVTLHYSIDMLAVVREYLNMTRKVHLIYNTKDKDAYLTSDVQPMRTK